MLKGTITVRRPRVRALDERFVSCILPLFQRRTPEVTALLPEWYLHGLATGDCELTLRGLLGDAAPLSASAVQRLTLDWQQQYAAWKTRDLSTLDHVYVWADGIYVKAGLETSKAALFVLIGRLADGTKVVLAVKSSVRESTERWAMTIRVLTGRGLRPPQLTCADDHLGIWGAVGSLRLTSAEQRCWNHRLRNVVDAVPLKAQAEVQLYVQKIAAADTRADAEHERKGFHRAYGLRYPKAGERRDRDWDRMIRYYDCPKEHWRHLRTTNVVESPFAAVRLRTSAAKRFKKVENATAIIWRLLLVAESRFRKLNAPAIYRAVLLGVRYLDSRPAAAHPPRSRKPPPDRTFTHLLTRPHAMHDSHYAARGRCIIHRVQ